MILPTLYKLDSKKQYRYWECKVDNVGYYTKSGLLKYKDTHRWIYHVGSDYKAHVTWCKKKKEDNMSESMDIKDEYQCPPIPVLCYKYSDLISPNGIYYIQPKLDGERVTMLFKDNKVHAYSRLRNEILYLDNIKNDIYTLFVNNPNIQTYIFDGEIIHPSNIRNVMRSAISRKLSKHNDNDILEYHIFDMMTTPNMTFGDRYSLLRTVVTNDMKYVKYVPILGKVDISNKDDIDKFLFKVLDMKYEGIILRDLNMLYPTTKTRSKGVVKYKPYRDEEFKIINAYQGFDTHDGLIIFEVQDINNANIVFKVIPAMTHSERKELWLQFLKNPYNIVGKYATVKYKDRNENGIPLEPIAIDFYDTLKD